MAGKWKPVPPEMIEAAREADVGELLDTLADDQEAEGISAGEIDVLTRISAAWSAISDALDSNAQGSLSAGDVCAVGFAMQDRLRDPERRTWADMLRGPLL
jgi:hypothetical protein